MADNTSLIQTIISGLLSGGGSALTAFAAVFRDIKKRLTALETKIGNDGTDGEPKTGLFIRVERLNEDLSKLKKDVGAWEDDPPEWLSRLVHRTVRSTSVNLEHHHELEQLVEKRFRTNRDNIANLEEALDNYVGHSEYEKDTRQRSEELSSIREQLATANGMLRGIMSAMGYIDPTKTKKHPGE